MDLASLARLLRPLERRVASILSRGTWRLADDSGGRQTGQVTLLAGETRSALEHPQPFGLSAVPPDGAEAFAAFVGGNREHGLVLLVEDRRHRPRGLRAGEAALYNAHSVRLVLHDDGSVEVVAPGGVRVQGNLAVEGSISATGDVSDAAGSLQDLRDVYDVHQHQEHGDGGGITGPPLQQA